MQIQNTNQDNMTNAQSSSNLLGGVLLIALGASSYGMLSTFVKLAYKQGYTTAEVTGAQFIWGAMILTLLATFLPKKMAPPTSNEKLRLMVAGTTIGFTSVLYYVCVRYINASVAVVLLMQSIWLGVLFESLITKTFPTKDKIIAVFLVLFGTLLATNALDAANSNLDIRGIIFGVLSAISFSLTLTASGNIAPHLPPIKRSQFMLYGGIIVVGLFAFFTQLAPTYLGIKLLGSEFSQVKPFDFSILYSYGLLVAIFGTVLPPIMLNKGFPITGVALGSIISSIELPFAMMIASTLLGETLKPLQFVGVVIILVSFFTLNYRMITKDQ